MGIADWTVLAGLCLLSPGVGLFFTRRAGRGAAKSLAATLLLAAVLVKRVF